MGNVIGGHGLTLYDSPPPSLHWTHQSSSSSSSSLKITSSLLTAGGHGFLFLSSIHARNVCRRNMTATITRLPYNNGCIIFLRKRDKI